MLAACARPAAVAPAPPARIAIVAAERGPSGARLVAIDEHGNRMLEVVQPAERIARDTNPAVSPDARWIVFASSRGRALDETSLWIAPLEREAVAVPLTHGAWIDAHPTWTPDGRAIVFASTRGGAGYDLYRLAIDATGHAAGEPEQLTSAPGHEVTPSVARDGAIYYAEVTPRPDKTIESQLERRAPDGSIARVSDGPGDSSPAISPDGKTLAFVRPVERANHLVDAELWTMPVGGPESSEPVRVVDLPPTDEGGPVWSRDGRELFATSLLRGNDGKPVFSSVIVIDMAAPQRVARMLEDRVGAIARLTPAIVAPSLDAAAIATDPEYVHELARIVAAAIAKPESSVPGPEPAP
ncbi:MAG TPA: hypothetical protein VGF94_25640 [Kofleriaceae bacterium]